MACTNPAATGGGYNDYSSCDSGHGVCSPDTSTGSDLGKGYCVPKCSVPLAGGAATGCLPGDTCIPQTLASGATAATGSCEGGGCSTDADCAGDPTGTYTKCQKETLNCVKPASLVTYATTGTACSITVAGTTSPTNCICMAPNPTTATTHGYCSNICITGDAAHGCGTGYTCNPLLSTTYFTAVPTGISAYCVKSCTSSTTCPTGTTCQAVAGGKFCF
jgi:hypothetical protein